MSDQRCTPASGFGGIDANVSPTSSVDSLLPHVDQNGVRSRRTAALPPLTSKPSSNDACATIVMGLMMFNKSNDEEFSRKACESLVKKMKDKRDELDTLITAVFSRGENAQKCVTIARTLDGRLQVAGRKGFPHVVYSKIFRWPDLHKNELKHASCCENAFDLKGDSVCVNPYHYERIINPGLSHMDIKLDNMHLNKTPIVEKERVHLRTVQHSQSSMVSPTNGQHQFYSPPAQPQTKFVSPVEAQYYNSAANQVPPSTSRSYMHPVSPFDAHQEGVVQPCFNTVHPTSTMNSHGSHVHNQQFDQSSQHSFLQNAHDTQSRTSHIGSQMHVSESQQRSHFNCNLVNFDNNTTSMNANAPHLLRGPHNPIMPTRITSKFSGVAQGQNMAPPCIAPGTMNNTTLFNGSPTKKMKHPGEGVYTRLQNIRSVSDNSICVTSLEPPDDPVHDNWACFVYYEQKKRIGELQAKKNHMYIDGGFGNSPNRYCLGLEGNPERDDLTSRCRLNIGNGVRLSTKVNGDVWFEVRTHHPCFVHSQFLDRESGRSVGDVVHKVYPGSKLKIYDLGTAKQILRQRRRDALLASKYLDTVQAGADDGFPNFDLARLQQEAKQGADELNRFCVARVSFIKGWGPDYERRPDITDCPCWIEIKMNRAFTYLDRLLLEQDPDRLPQI